MLSAYDVHCIESSAHLAQSPAMNFAPEEKFLQAEALCRAKPVAEQTRQGSSD